MVTATACSCGSSATNQRHWGGPRSGCRGCPDTAVYDTRRIVLIYVDFSMGYNLADESELALVALASDGDAGGAGGRAGGDGGAGGAGGAAKAVRAALAAGGADGCRAAAGDDAPGVGAADGVRG